VNTAATEGARSMLRFSMIYNWIFQPRGPEEGEVLLNQRRVYIFPTRYGLFFAISLIAMLLTSINYDLSLGFVLVFFLAAAGLVTMLHTFRNQLHLTLAAQRADPVFAGGEARFNLLVSHDSIHERASIWLRTEHSSAVTDIEARSAAQVALTVPAPTRGIVRLPRITIETRYPLGLLRAWSHWQPALFCLVYPTPAAPGVPFPQAPDGDGEGASAGIGHEDFIGLREERFGDSPRHISWKHAALAFETEGPLLAKEFSGAIANEVMLDLAATSGASIEAQLSQLTRWVLDAHARKLSATLKLGGEIVGPGAGDAHRDACLKALALYGVKLT
jgi:uncharacterized protein (DUF58 family)